MLTVNKFSYAGRIAFTRAIFTIVGWDFSKKITSHVSSLGKSCRSGIYRTRDICGSVHKKCKTFRDRSVFLSGYKTNST